MPDEQSAHCAIGRLSCRAFWFTTTVAALDGGNAHRSCDTTDGEGAFDEQHPNFVGTYSAGASSKEVRQAIEDADRVICVGTRFVDTLTAGFTQQLPAERTLEIQPYASRIGETWFNLPMAQAVSTLRELCLECAFAPPPTRSAGQPVRIDKGELTQESFWQTLQQYLKPGDIILVDQGQQLLALPRCRFLTARKLCYSRCGGLSAIPCPPRLARKPPVPIGG